jgi:uncharacterized protein
MRTKLYFLAVALLVASLLTGCASAAYAQSSTPSAPAAGETPEPVNRTISVNGSGKAYLTPDIAYITIGVHTEGPVAAEAVAQNNANTQKVIAALKGAGIAEKDIQTTNFSISPQPVYDDQNKPTGKITYLVDNSVFVTVRDITKVGDVLDATVKAGANSISGIQFDVADKTAALSTARQAAVKDAQAKATELASAAGVTLGPVQTINEYSSPSGPMYDMRAPAPMAAQAASVPIQPGQMLITVEVSVVYGIQ